MRSLYRVNKCNFSSSIKNDQMLVVNAGSSSLKYKLFNVENETLSSQCHGIFERMPDKYRYTHHVSNNSSPTLGFIDTDKMDYSKCVAKLFSELLTPSISSSSSLIVGHRIVHGGDTYSDPQIIDESVTDVIDRYSQIAPLHNPFQLECIRAITNQKYCSIDSQFAVFDTSFHSNMPKQAYTYAINKDTANEYQKLHNIELRRFGFHGISYQYLLDRTCAYLNKPKEETNIIALHLGSGCSICCIQNGQSVDTSMGWTPSEGLVMSTRAGDIDSGLVLALMDAKENGMDIDIKKELNSKSGMYGMCNEKDMRQIYLNKDDENYANAMNVFAHRVKKYIGAYYAVLNGKVGAVVLSGGIGENIKFELFGRIFRDLDGLGLRINNERKEKTQDVFQWSRKDSIPILSVKTDEEMAIAMQIQQMRKKMNEK